MKNQFYYTREEEKLATDGSGAKTKLEFIDSLNLSTVIRTLQMEDGRRLVLLNDMHERMEEVPQFDKMKKRIVGYTKQRNTFQSEIYLSKEDGERYINVTNIDNEYTRK